MEKDEKIRLTKSETEASMDSALRYFSPASDSIEDPSTLRTCYIWPAGIAVKYEN